MRALNIKWDTDGNIDVYNNILLNINVIFSFIYLSISSPFSKRRSLRHWS